jgi:hypothetical protein
VRKLLIVFLLISATACVQQTVHQRSTFLDNHSFDAVWDATLKAVYDIKFTVDSVDRESGFISALRGQDVLQHAPPRLSILISDMDGKVLVDCKVLQQEQYIDILGHGKRTIRNLINALNANLNLTQKGRGELR